MVGTLPLPARAGNVDPNGLGRAPFTRRNSTREPGGRSGSAVEGDLGLPAAEHRLGGVVIPRASPRAEAVLGNNLFSGAQMLDSGPRPRLPRGEYYGSVCDGLKCKRYAARWRLPEGSLGLVAIEYSTTSPT